MIRSREEFVKALWEDYRNFPEKQREQSFIYAYLKMKKDNRAEMIAGSREALWSYMDEKRQDKYVLLRSAYLAYENQCISQEEYRGILEKVANGKNKACSEGKAIKQREDGLDKEKLAAKQQRLERRFLLGCVSDFFQNAGYRVHKNGAAEEHVKLPDKHRKENNGYTDELEMLYAFYCYQGENSGIEGVPSFYNVRTTGASLDEEYLEQCRSLYHVLNREKWEDAFVPLLVDSNTGAGVYLIGRNKYQQYSDGKQRRKIRRQEEADSFSCYACVIYFSAIFEEISEYQELNLTMLVEKYATVQEAFARFQDGISNEDFYENYPLENGDKLPEGIDHRFNLYFVEKKLDAMKRKEEEFRSKVKEGQAKKERERYERSKIQKERK